MPADRVLAALTLLCAMPLASAADSVADGPQAIRPLAVGATAPAVTLADDEGAPVELGELLAKRPTVLVFYRGHW